MPHGVIEFISRTNLEGHDDADRELMLAMCEASGKPMNVNPIVRLPFLGDGWERGLEFVDVARARGLRVHPQSSLQQMQVFFALHDTFLFDEMEAFREVLTAGDRREALLADPAVRERLRDALADTDGRAFVFTWDAVKVARADAHPEWVGRTVDDLAREWGSDPLDAFLDASLAEHLTHHVHARRLARRQVARDDRAVRAPSRRASPAAATPARTSPATAASTSRPACSPTTCRTSSRSRTRCGGWRRSRRRCTASPIAAPCAPGARPTSWSGTRTGSGVGPTRWADDFPAGGGRFVVESTGYRALVVNGAVLLDDGVDTGARAGQVLRPG